VLTIGVEGAVDEAEAAKVIGLLTRQRITKCEREGEAYRIKLLTVFGETEHVINIPFEKDLVVYRRNVFKAIDLPHGVEERRFVALEIEVEDDQRPAGTVVPLKRFFHDGPDALEKVVAQRRLGAGCLVRVRDDGASLARGAVNAPSQVLFDSDRVSGLEGAIDPVCPIAFVGVAVMGVEDRAVVIEKIEGRAGRRHRLPHRRNLGDEGPDCEKTL